jgi:hypothetical protein
MYMYMYNHTAEEIKRSYSEVNKTYLYTYMSVP